MDFLGLPAFLWALVSAAISFVACLLMGRKLIPYLRRLKLGQKILEIGPNWHMSKQGTPVMGGLMFIFGTLVSLLALGYFIFKAGAYDLLAVLFLGLSCAAIGFLDDYEKILKKRNLGLSVIQKLVLQIAVALLFITLLRLSGHSISEVYLPFFNTTFRISPIIWSIFAVIIIVGTVNAANLTDGIDGLATGVTLPMTAFFSITALMWDKFGLSLAAAALFGGLCGFLIYNFNPAKIFMGDTGSLFLGGMVAGFAFALDMPLIIAVACLVYLIEALSDVIQVGYFKLSRGRRVFKMAPIHHHFEMCGWSEKKVFSVFSLVSLALCALAYIGVMFRY